MHEMPIYYVVVAVPADTRVRERNEPRVDALVTSYVYSGAVLGVFDEVGTWLRTTSLPETAWIDRKWVKRIR